MWAENDKSVKAWTSENLSIRYWNPVTSKYSNYYPDFLIILEDGKKVIIEIKPKSLLVKPKAPKRLTESTRNSYKYKLVEYTKNMAKITAVTNYCTKKGWYFKIISDDWFK